MVNEFTKPTKINPAIVGQIADPDVYNQNIAGQSKGTIVPIDIDGNYADGDIGDQTLGSTGALIANLKLRQGGFIKIYNSSGVFVKDVSLDQATESAIGQAEIAIQSEVDTGTDNEKFVTPLKLANAAGHQVGYAASILATQASGSGNFPKDTSIPQQSEGNEFTTISYTPKNATSLLEIEFFAMLSAGDLNYCLALFQDATSDAIAVSAHESSSGAREVNLYSKITVSAASTSARTYKLRYGVGSGTCYINRRSTTANLYGGVIYSGIIVREIAQ